jgi:hypothetical protein
MEMQLIFIKYKLNRKMPNIMILLCINSYL